MDRSEELRGARGLVFDERGLHGVLLALESGELIHEELCAPLSLEPRCGRLVVGAIGVPSTVEFEERFASRVAHSRAAFGTQVPREVRGEVVPTELTRGAQRRAQEVLLGGVVVGLFSREQVAQRTEPLRAGLVAEPLESLDPARGAALRSCPGKSGRVDPARTEEDRGEGRHRIGRVVLARAIAERGTLEPFELGVDLGQPRRGRLE